MVITDEPYVQYSGWLRDQCKQNCPCSQKLFIILVVEIEISNIIISQQLLCYNLQLRRACSSAGYKDQETARSHRQRIRPVKRTLTNRNSSYPIFKCVFSETVLHNSFFFDQYKPEFGMSIFCLNYWFCIIWEHALFLHTFRVKG